MATLWPVLIAPFVGSFLGVIVTRLPQGRSVVHGRSACEHCGHVLGPLELVPLVSWAIQRGRCRTCGGKIDPVLPAVELIAVIVAIWAVTVFSDDAQIWVSAAFGWVLLCLGTIDLRHFTLPDVLTLPLIPVGLAAAQLLWPERIKSDLIGAALGGGLFWLLRVGYRRFREREGLGLGDVKLAAAAGAWVGWDGLGSVVLLAALVGISVALLALTKGRPMRAADRMPFGTYLCIAIWLVWLYGPLALDLSVAI